MEILAILGVEETPQTILSKQIQQLQFWVEQTYLSPNLYQETEVFVDVIVSAVTRKRNIYFTGIGKNIPALRKACATLKSLGVSAHAFEAVDGLHGDLGTLQYDDILIAVSKSGDTVELLQTMNYVKENNLCSTFGISMGGNVCGFDRCCQTSIKLPIVEELDNWNKVPTTSAIAFQMYLDSVIMVVAHKLGVRNVDFKLWHPGGDINKKFREEEKNSK